MTSQNIKIPGLHATEDLSSNQYHAVYLTEDRGVTSISDSNVANFAQAGIGVLQNDPDEDGKAAEVICVGVAKCEAGGTITQGAYLTINNDGEFIAGAIEAWDSSTADRAIIGRAIEDASDGDWFDALVNFITPIPHDTE